MSDTRLRILLLDNYDSFTWNLYDSVTCLGAECVVCRNDAIDLATVQAMSPDGILLSPGPKRPSDAGIMPAMIQQWHDKLPILGVCLGHQALGAFFGADLVKAAAPMHGKTSWIQHQGHPLFAEIPRDFEVMRYHSLILENLPDVLVCIASSKTGEIMALAHRTHPLWGVQFHPESVLTPQGNQMVSNWLAQVSRCKSKPEIVTSA